MATYLTRKGRVTALIRRKDREGRPINMSRTFPSREEAEAWAEQVERNIDQQLSQVESVRQLPFDISILPRYDAMTGAMGVYFLFLRGECIYVGQSENVHSRVREHRLPKNDRKEFDSYAFLPVAKAQLTEVEFHYIRLLSPKLNSTGREDLKAARQLDRSMSAEDRAAIRISARKRGVTKGQHRILRLALSD